MITAHDCLARYGDPVLERAMILWDVPEHLEIGVIPRRIYCNQDLVVPLSLALEHLRAAGLASVIKTWDGCFNIRKSKGHRLTWSLHAWGLAVDIDAAWNRYGRPPTMDSRIVECFEGAGFEWGGRWKTPDGMHFQLREFDT